MWYQKTQMTRFVKTPVTRLLLSLDETKLHIMVQQEVRIKRKALRRAALLTAVLIVLHLSTCSSSFWWIGPAETRHANDAVPKQELFFYPTDLIPMAMQRKSPHRIPHQLIFVGKHNILETQKPKVIFDNLWNTINSYREAWNEPDAPVWFLDDALCAELIGFQNQTLLALYESEKFGPFKSDICRAVALYLVGGYYFDNDIAVMTRPYVVPSAKNKEQGISFVTVLMKDERFVCQCIMMAESHSAILRTSFDTVGEYYQNKPHKRSMTLWMGPWSVKTAMDRELQKNNSSESEVVLMYEKLLDDNFDPNHTLPRQKFTTKGIACNQAIGFPLQPSSSNNNNIMDPRPMDPYFWTRAVGINKYCA
jgi:hypothetical protein